MKKTLFAFIAILIMAACITEKKHAKICASCPVVIKDSINTVYKTTPFDTTLFLKGYKNEPVNLPGQCSLLCDSLEALMLRYNNRFETSTNGIKTVIIKDKNGYKIQSLIDSLKIKLTLLQKEKQSARIVYKDRVKLEECKRAHSWPYIDPIARIVLLIFIFGLIMAIFECVKKFR